MVEILAREIRKLEVRIERFVITEESFVNELQNCLEKFKELNQNLESAKTVVDPKIVETLSALRLVAIEALNKALKKGSETEHEKSHLLESYGALILSIENAFKDLT